MLSGLVFLPLTWLSLITPGAAVIMATSRIINKAATHAIAPSDPTEEEMFMAAYANGTRPMSSGILRAEQCPSCRKLINYPEALRNSPTGDWHATAGVLVLWVFALLWLLNTTAQDFFVPPLVYWSKLLCLRPEISGATLVALGNGAPDAFAMITATRAEDVPLALTTVLGSMMSVLCITGSAIVFTAEQLHSRAKSSGDSGKQMDLNFHPTFDSTSAVGLSAGILYMAVLMQTGQASVDKAVVMPVLYALYLMVLTRQPAAAVEETAENEKEAVGATPALPGLDMPTNASWLRLLPWGLAWLTYVARWILIPPSDRHWDRTRRVFSSLAPTGVILFWAKTSLGSCAALFANPASTVALLLGLLASVAIYAGSDDGPSLPFFYPALTLLAKASSILVLSVIAGELTACVETLGLVLGVARLSLGTTVMSWGNSLGDLVVGLAMVRQGQCRAAFTAVFAGPIFNCLFSAGIVLTCAAASTNSGVVMLWTDDAGRTNLRLHVAFLAVACSVLTLTLRFQQSAGNFAPFALLVLYSAFLACSLSVEQSELQS